MKIVFVILTSITSFHLAIGQHTNVTINYFNNPNETSIMLDPLNPNRIVAGANLRNYYVSLDTGKTWTNNLISSSSYGVWGDPSITVDAKGNFYFFHLSNPPAGSGNWIDRIVCQKSTDFGFTWNDGTFTGLNGIKVQDKQWPAVNRKNNHIYLTWTQFDAYASSVSSDSSIILFSKSVDDGGSWSAPMRINKKSGDCLDDDNTVEGAVPAIGPNGEIYVAWAGPQGIIFDRSLDDGDNWLSEDIFVSTMPGGWAYDVSGIYRANGLPVTVCDTSASPYRGTIYINWTDQRNGSNDTDVWITKSTDGGDTWSPVKRVNNDGVGYQQFFSWLTIDPVTGYLYVVFYDRRNLTGTKTNVYLALSKDGGETFINRRISQSPFVPNSSIFFGDYTNIVAYNGIVRPIWTRLHNDQLTSVTALIDTADFNIQAPVTGVESLDENLELSEVYPNPAREETYVSYKLHRASYVTLIIRDALGSEVLRLIDNVKTQPGKYIERVSVDDRLPNGIYYYTLISEDVKKSKRFVIVR